MLKAINDSSGGDIIVPMTLTSPVYYNDIISRLIADGIDVRHFILYVNKPELIKRLRRRALGFLRREKFAVEAIERCIHSFDNNITETRIMAYSKSAEDIALEIAALCK